MIAGGDRVSELWGCGMVHNPGTNSLRVAVVGGGLMGRWHAYTARRLGARVVAFADRDIEPAKSLANRTPGAKAFDDLDAILNSEQVDVVHICTPPATHFPLSMKAVASGAHVFLEKPTTERADETRKLLEAADAAGVLVCPVHQYGFQRGVERALSILDALNGDCCYSFNYCSAGSEGRPGVALDEILGEIFPHPLSILRILKPDTPLDVRDWQICRTHAGELTMQGTLGSSIVTMFCSMIARPTCFELKIHCDRGTIELNFFHGYALFHSGKVSRLRKIIQPFASSSKTLVTASENLLYRTLHREPAYPGLHNLMKRFFGAVQGICPNPIPADETLAVAVGREALLRKAFPDF